MNPTGKNDCVIIGGMPIDCERFEFRFADPVKLIPEETLEAMAWLRKRIAEEFENVTGPGDFVQAMIRTEQLRDDLDALRGACIRFLEAHSPTMELRISQLYPIIEPNRPSPPADCNLLNMIAAGLRLPSDYVAD